MPNGLIYISTILLSVAMTGSVNCDMHQDLNLIDHMIETNDPVSSFPETNIFMLEFDVTGDGLKEIFLCPEVTMGAGSALINHVYSPVGGGHGYRYLGIATFTIYGYRFEQEKSRLVVINSFRQDSRNIVYLSYYAFDEDGVHAIGESDPIGWTRDERELQYRLNQSWRESIGLSLLKAPLPNIRQSLRKKSGSHIPGLDIYSKQDRNISDNGAPQ